MSELIDWSTAVEVGARIAGDGPEVTAAEANAVVAELREGATRSTGLVRDFTGLVAQDHNAPLLVVDRRGWIQANAESFAVIMDPVVEKMLAQRKEAQKGAPSGLTARLGSKVTGAEFGLIMGFLSGKVLGQFDPFYGLERGTSERPRGQSNTAQGRLLLVAPNIVHVERELNVDPHDFRLWVCLHEETHRVQFTAVPWMREHLHGLIGEVVGALEPTTMLDDLVKRVSQGVREGKPVRDLFRTPEQQAVIDKITGVMSLLEGHADVVMDGVGPSIIPSVHEIRRKFTARRGGVGLLDKLLRRLLGLDAKMAQYRDGAKFVRAVVDKAGMVEFNAVFAGPENLPTKEEIHDPQAWLARVLTD